MKNKRLKIKTLNFYLFLFLFLFSLLAFSACPDLFNPELTNKRASGKGSFLLSINGLHAGRTIIPLTEQNDFKAYTLDFYNTGGTLIVSETRTNNNLYEPVLLDAGNYKLVVTAYMDAGKTKPAAYGELNGISIAPNGSYSGSVTLTAVINDGQGVFKWNISYPSSVTIAKMTVIPFDNGSGTAEQTVFFKGGTPVVNGNGSLTLNSGYYRVVFYLYNNTRSVERRELLHIYKNMESTFTYTFTDGHFTYLIVTSEADSGVGSLRNAISAAPSDSTIIIDPTVKTIALQSGISIYYNLYIEGNGVTITRASSWTSTYDRFISIYSSVEINISRVWFKEGRTTESGVAVYNNNGNVTLESCIFSGNRSNLGGAIYNSYGNMNVKGCTFYGNKVEDYGGAICISGGTLTLTGNLFYGNAASFYSVVYRNYGNISSIGYNVVDVELGEGSGLSGWYPGDGDKTVNIPMVSSGSMKLLPGSQAAGIITQLPYWYPTTDFYGNSISDGAAAGAVQSLVSGEGYYLELSVNDTSRGSVNVTPQLNTEGFVQPPYTVTINATPAAGDYYFAYWLVNGVESEITSSSLPLTLGSHTRVQAVFSKDFRVTIFSDSSNSETTSGTLRHALTNVINGDKVIMTGVTTPGQTSIALRGALPDIKKKITIEGNGITITRASSWSSDSDRFLYINNTVTISRIWFKDSRGVAIYNYYTGNVTIESCVFSGNGNQSSSGGAIYNYGTMNIKGCTFYGNSAVNEGGAIYCYNSTLNLTGNLFLGNTAPSNPVVGGWSITSNGYNVVDVSNSGWSQMTGDKTISTFPISGKTFRLLSGSEAEAVITELPPGYPRIDFYGYFLTDGAAAGAVQATTGDGIYIEVSVNESGRGSVSGLPSTSEADGLITGPVTLTAVPVNSGYYLAYWLVNGKKDEVAKNSQYLTLESSARVKAVFGKDFIVNNITDNDSGDPLSGTLRHAVANVIDGDKIILSTTMVTPGQTTIELKSSLNISKNITIEGKGITITRASSWTSSSCLLSIGSNNYCEVTINRVWFKDGRSTGDGGAIQNGNGNVTLESCIFSGNHSNSGGGAIRNDGTMNVKGCTFYNNSAYYGGAIYGSGTLTLTGNLFYGNTAPSSPVTNGGTSNGYNIVDVPISWSSQTGDDKISSFPISGKTFKLIPTGNGGGGAAGVITTALSDYPTRDFYDNPINIPAAAGAVQSNVSGSGYYLGLSVNDSSKGSVTPSPQINSDGIVASGQVTITATPYQDYVLAYWLVDKPDADKPDVEKTNPLVLSVSQHNIKVQAVFEKVFNVTIFTDSGNSETTPGTLRYALANALDGDKIILSGVTPGVTTISLTKALPVISNNITIEGNGITITRASSWSSSPTQFLNISSSTVTISRVWFKDGIVNYDYGAAVYNYSGNVTLESCIFSGNQSIIYSGGAIYNYGIMNVKGCTFYGNSAIQRGGAIYNSSSTLTLAGNLFYGNTASSAPVVYPNGTVTSNGYNVVDVPVGTNSTESGWSTGTGDKQVTDMPISGKTFKLLSGSGAAAIVETTLLTDYPKTDFYGNNITGKAAAGAVQGSVSGSGIYIEVSVNNSGKGSVSVSPTPSSDGLALSPVITATPAQGYTLMYWIVNGERKEATSSSLSLTTHSIVQAVFGKELTVSSSSDVSGSDSTQGTLRYAITNAQDGDKITINITTGQTTIALRTGLSISNKKNIIIEGNGITITRASSCNDRLLSINNSEVTISHIYFKDGRSSSSGAAIHNSGGDVTIESCIFSGNQATSGGGAICNEWRTMSIKGCSFYENSSSSFGGAIRNVNDSILTLEGNLFYGNTQNYYSDGYSSVIYSDWNQYVTSNGYNVVDVSNSGLTAHSTDKTISDLNISGVPFNTTTFEPVPSLRSVIGSKPDGFPNTDFNGATRTFPGAPGAVK